MDASSFYLFCLLAASRAFCASLIFFFVSSLIGLPKRGLFSPAELSCNLCRVSSLMGGRLLADLLIFKRVSGLKIRRLLASLILCRVSRDLGFPLLATLILRFVSSLNFNPRPADCAFFAML